MDRDATSPTDAAAAVASVGPQPAATDLTNIRAVADLLPQLAWSCGLDGHFEYLSRRWVEYTGIPEPELLGVAWLGVVHPDDRARTTATWEAFVAGTASYDVDYRLRRHDGTYRWFQARGEIVRDAAGCPVRAVGTTADIDRQVRAEHALRHQSELLRTLTENATTATFMMDKEGRTTFMNPAAEAMTGFTFKELEHKVLHDHVHRHRPDGSPFAFEDCPIGRTLLGRNALRDHEDLFIRKNGSFCPVRCSARSIVSDGAPVGIVLEVVDLTEEKAALAALRESEERFRVLVTATSDVVYRMNPDWSEMRQLVGREFIPDTAEPSRSWLTRYIPPGDRDRVIRGIADAVAAKATFEMEHQVYRLDGSVGWTFSRAIPVLGRDGEIAEWFGAASDITSRKQTEESLRESRERLSAALKTARMCAWSWHPSSDRVFASDNMGEVYGLHPGEAVRTSDLGVSLVHPEDRDRHRELVRWAIERGESWHTEFRIVRPADGRVAWLEERATADRDPGTGEILLSGLVWDITERKQSEMELARITAESGQRTRLYETILSNTPDLAYVFDLDHRFTYANEVLLRMWGRAWEDAIGKTCLELGYPDWHAAMHDREIEQVKQTRLPIRGEVPFAGTFGRRIYDYIFVPVFGPGGEVEAVAGTTRDVTERKEAEEGLRASEERFRAFMDNSPAASWITEADGRVRYVSGTYGRMFQVPDRDLVGAAAADLYPESFAEDYIRTIRAVAESGRPIEVVERAPRPDGTVGDFLVYKFPLPGAELVGGVAVDITDRLRAEAALREADRRKDEFLALLAHELRNPLAPLRNGLQVIRLAGAGTEVAERARAMMERQLAHMVRLIDDLLDVSRITRGKLNLRRERLLLSDVIAHAVETSRPMIESGSHEMSLLLPVEPVYIDGDLTRLSQVFSNLLTNAAKYTDRGGRIRLVGERRGRSVAVVVSDTGIGIPAESIPSIFDMFSQVDRSIQRSTGGLGIGLALVKGLVDMHGGTVTAASAGPGLGCTFTVVLPDSDLGPEPRAASPGIAARSPRRRVLIVDDNRDAAESLGMMLSLLGNEVRLAEDGEESIQAARAFLPDLILMDIGMPRVNGLDATRMIREEPWGAGVTIIALTGWGQDADRQRSKEAGCDGHLVKPVDLDELQRLMMSTDSGAP